MFPVNGTLQRLFGDGIAAIFGSRSKGYGFASSVLEANAAPDTKIAFKATAVDRACVRQRRGGESGIRTHETLTSLHAFQACAFNHSAISP